MREDQLQRIQSLQFTDRSAANRLMLEFLRTVYSNDVASVELRPQAVSLNSFNGFLTNTQGQRLFFKTHTEADSVITEYYNSSLLAQAGYPIIHPVFASTQPGIQLLIYERIDDTSVFDLAWKIELGETHALDSLSAAQSRADAGLRQIFEATLRQSPATTNAAAPVHQLFFHRLVAGRMTRFYGGIGDSNSPSRKQISLSDRTVSWSDIMSSQWTVNNQLYEETLIDVIQRAKILLEPSLEGPVIIGHGDAHNGNVFYRVYATEVLPQLIYFDPAFAGYHHPLLDLAKPLFHNVFAMWMYFPQHFADRVDLRLERYGDRLHIDYRYPLPAVRTMFLESKVTHVLAPTLVTLAERNLLRPDWRTYVKAALFCCSFLTMNLSDTARFPPEISLLGLAMSIEMGSESRGQRSPIDTMLDQVQRLLGL